MENVSAVYDHDESGRRTDIHRPVTFDPKDYEERGFWDTNPPLPDPRCSPEDTRAYMDWRREYLAACAKAFGGRIPHQCEHCGHAWLRFVAEVVHRPTGAIVPMGEDCVRNRLGITMDEFRIKAIHDKAARDAAHLKNLATRAAWDAANPEVAAFLATIDRDAERFDFLLDVTRKLDLYFELSERQTAAVLKIKASREAKATERAATEVIPIAPAPEGNACEIEGEIVKTKSQDSGYGESLKMLVLLDDGNKVWATVPAVLFSGQPDGWDMILAGHRVRFTAECQRSDRDEHFSFCKRPRKAELVAA